MSTTLSSVNRAGMQRGLLFGRMDPARKLRQPYQHDEFEREAELAGWSRFEADFEEAERIAEERMWITRCRNGETL